MSLNAPGNLWKTSPTLRMRFLIFIVVFQLSLVRPCNRPIFCSRFAVRFPVPYPHCHRPNYFVCFDFRFALWIPLPYRPLLFSRYRTGISHRHLLFYLSTFFVSYPVSRLLDLTGGTLRTTPYRH